MTILPDSGEAILRKLDCFAARPRGVALILVISCADADQERMAARVPQNERDRAARFRRADDRTRYLAGRVALRAALGRIVHARGAHSTLHFSDSGKPYLPGGPAFSLSHSGDVVLVGFAWNTEIGVDVEQLRPLPEIEALTKLCLSGVEASELHGIQPADQRALRFLSLWTRKEAISKAMGLGLSLPFDSFSCLDHDAPKAVQMNSPIAAHSWTMLDLTLPPSHIGAAAVIGEACDFIHVATDMPSLCPLASTGGTEPIDEDVARDVAALRIASGKMNGSLQIAAVAPQIR